MNKRGSAGGKTPAPEKKRAKRRFSLRSLKFIVIIAAVLAAVFFFAADPLFHLGIGFDRTARTSVSHYILENAKPVFALHTIEYTVKTVFPYDYGGDPAMLYRSMRKFSLGKEFNDAEKANIRLFRLLAEINFPLSPKKHEFIVVKVRLRAGYDISGDETLSEDDFRRKVRSMVKTDRRSGTVIFTLPDPEIVDVIIEDPAPEEYGFPDVSLSPGEWKDVALFITENIKTNKLVDGMLAEAAENTKALLSELFESGGWKNVVFVSPDSGQNQSEEEPIFPLEQE